MTPLRIFMLRFSGRMLMRRYVLAVESICNGEHDYEWAEVVCPSLKRMRRRARAIARSARRLIRQDRAIAE